jgi:glycosyltransferase involved in cell wall biosynthesis
MDLIINKVAYISTSHGGKRYFEGIFKELCLNSNVSFSYVPPFNFLKRPFELLQFGNANSIYWSPCHRGPLFAKNHVVTVLDCINIKYSYKFGFRKIFLRYLTQKILHNAIAIVAISHATRGSILENYNVDPNKVVVIPGPTKFDLPQQFPCEVFDSKYVLLVTNSLPHKNTFLALKAFSKSNAASLGVSLKVVGSVDFRGLNLCEEAGVDVIFYNKLTDNELISLYKQAIFLFSPSLDEGLNLPIGEALNCKCPVLCSDISVHREFYGDYVSYFSPSNLDSIISGINESLQNHGTVGAQNAPFHGISFRDVALSYQKLFLKLSSNIKFS